MIAIIAIIAATAGWTTVAVLALRPTQTAAVAVPTDSFDPTASDGTDVPPVADSHDAPDLEAVLPAALDGTALQFQSVLGDTLLADDSWSTSVRSFLTGAGKTATDLRFAQAYDPAQAIDLSIDVYQVRGVAAAKVRDALVTAWKGDYPDMAISEVTLGGKKLTKGAFAEADTPGFYIYLRDDLVFDIWSSDDAAATTTLAALPAPGASRAPASRVPASSAASPSTGPSPAPS
ncbi:MAG: hypothetical protein ABJC39_01040 [Chloroflexota bacterium]